jgi:hypothetical protein
MRGSIATQKGD